MLGNAINRAGLQKAGPKNVRRLRFAMIFPVRAFFCEKIGSDQYFIPFTDHSGFLQLQKDAEPGFRLYHTAAAPQQDPTTNRPIRSTSHLQMFNTHPYLTAAVIGSVVRLEEDGDKLEADHLKKAVMGPYAAIGDSFFWGRCGHFRPLAL